jgi:type IV pilus assembly protein PilB
MSDTAQSSTPSSQTPSAGNSTLLDVLLQIGAVSQSQYDDVILEHVNTGKTVETIVEDQRLVTDEQLTKAKSVVYNIPLTLLSEVGSSPEALALVPEALARRYQMVPFALEQETKTISVAMINPLDLSAIDFVEKKTGYRVHATFTMKDEIDRAIAERYSQNLSEEVSAAIKETSGEEDVQLKTFDAKSLANVIREAPIAKIVETILTFAMKARASDIHIEPQETKIRVRYRIDGILQEKLILPRSVHDAVVSRIKILSDLKIDEKRIPQDGRFSFRVDLDEVDLRVSTLPTVHGEKIVMRLLKKTGNVPTLQELGLRGTALKNLEIASKVPHGIILVTGPTGSGKTTTLYSLLHKLNTPKVNIVTLEDPVEYQMHGVNQVQINPQAGLTFASGLRAFLRQDPNIIMVGEVRDQETADLAIQAALTGHLVFSTLHTNSASGALPRLLDMKAEPFLLASSMTLVMAQRVLRKICEHCKEAYQPDPAVEEDMKVVLGSMYDGWKQEHPEQFTLYKGKGCLSCGDSGYSGRTGIYEVMLISEKIGKLILERKPASEIERQAIEEGMLLMKQDGYMKVLEGITAIEEVLRVAQI